MTFAAEGTAFRVFANPRATARSWYPTVLSRKLRRGRIQPFALRHRRVAIYRDRNDRAHAIDARCAHLGADLTRGAVEGSGIRCAFHGWCFGAGGACTSAPGYAEAPPRSVRAYPCIERWGLVWIFNGETPLFPLPSPESGEWSWWRLPSQRIRCHPHLVLANGLDVTHYETLHDMAFTDRPALTLGHHDVSVTMRGRPRSRLWRMLSGARHRDIEARFTTLGGSLAWTSVTAPVRFHVLFSGAPDSDGYCVTRTIFLFPKGIGAERVRALGLMATLLHDDRRVLDRIDFRPEFAAADEPLRAYAQVVDALGSW